MEHSGKWGIKDFFERSGDILRQAQDERGRKIGLVIGSRLKRSGFTLLEILIVIAIIGILGSIIMPNIGRSTPRYEREAFIARFNSLLQYAWQHALTTGKIHQVVVDIAQKTVKLLQESDEVDRSGAVYKPIIDPTHEVEFTLPDYVNIKQFFIEGFDMMTKYSRSKSASVWFYIMPEGLAQDVIINFVDTHDLADNKPRQVGLILNPFSVQFKVYDTFQKP